MRMMLQQMRPCVCACVSVYVWVCVHVYVSGVMNFSHHSRSFTKNDLSILASSLIQGDMNHFLKITQRPRVQNHGDPITPSHTEAMRSGTALGRAIPARHTLWANEMWLTGPPSDIETNAF
jgi:hypothetical protein